MAKLKSAAEKRRKQAAKDTGKATKKTAKSATHKVKKGTKKAVNKSDRRRRGQSQGENKIAEPRTECMIVSVRTI
jgi:hypothetical protein